MSKTKVTRKAVSTKEKANRATGTRFVSIVDAIRGIEFPYMLRPASPNGEIQGPAGLVYQMTHDLEEYRRAAKAMRKAGDAELKETATQLIGYLDAMVFISKAIRGTLAKAKSRAAQLEGR